MALQWDENPLLFVNLTDAFISGGRNARVKSRTQQLAAQNPARAQKGTFVTLNFQNKALKRTNNIPSKGKSRRRPAPRRSSKDAGNTCRDIDVQPRAQHFALPSPYNELSSLQQNYWSIAGDPTNVLIVASFHIRRMAAIALKQRPDSLIDVLRYRQWCCIPPAFQTFQANSCLASALIALTLKLDKIIGGRVRNYDVLSSYTNALHKLQRQLLRPKRGDMLELLTTTKLLTLYEMLDSFDNAGWRQHAAGTESLVSSWGSRCLPRQNRSFSFETIAPIMTSALLSGNLTFFRQFHWQASLDDLKHSSAIPNEIRAELEPILVVPKLLVDAEDVICGDRPDLNKYEILDQAHLMKSRIENALLDREESSVFDMGKSTAFDRLGLSLSALVALDRVIVALRPALFSARYPGEDNTSQLCAQMIQLELKVADAGIDVDLVSAFHL